MARTSPLSSLYSTVQTDIPSGLPSWMFGGSFNQIEEDVLGLQAKRQALDLQQQQEEANALRIQQQQNEMAAAEELAQKYAEKGDGLTFEDSIKLGKQTALNRGLFDQYIRMTNLEQQQQQQDERERRAAITEALSYGRLGATPFAEERLRLAGVDPSTVFTDEFKARTEKYLKSGGNIYGIGDGTPNLILNNPNPGGSDRDLKPYVNKAGDIQYVSPRDYETRKKLVASGYQPGETYSLSDIEQLQSAMGAPAPKTGEVQSQQQQQLVQEIKSKPPPPPARPGESFEEYKRRVGGN